MTFPARYPGSCELCGRRFYPGEAIGYDPDSNLLHESCLAEHSQAVEDEARVCPGCQLQHAGECF